MNETKFKSGDKVRVKSDLIAYQVYGVNTFVAGMAHLKGKEVTIKSVGPQGNYTIEEGRYAWTDEMFEEIVPKYVECTKSGGNASMHQEYKGINVEKGKIYKVISKSMPNRGAQCIAYVLEGGGVCYCEYTKSSTKEAYEAQFKPKFKVGQWYKCNEGFFGKFLKRYTWNEFVASEHYITNYQSVDGGYPFNNGYKWEEATNEEIQFFLPEGHPEKKFTFIKDEYYTSFYRGKLWQIFIYKEHLGERGCETGHYISTTSYCYFGPTYSTTLGLSDGVTHRLSTPEEKQWLDACVKANKFISKEEALNPKPKEWSVGTYVVFLKDDLQGNKFNVGDVQEITSFEDCIFRVANGMGNTVKGTFSVAQHIKWFPTLAEAETFSKELLTSKITVESEMQRLGLAIGNKVTVVDEPIEDGYYDGYSTEKLKAVRGKTYTISGGVFVKEKLYLNMEEFDSSESILAEAVIKNPKPFKLGSYEVTVSDFKVKIGCTPLDRSKVTEFLSNFIAFSSAFDGDGEGDFIHINGVDIDYDTAESLLDYINKH